MFGVCGLAFGMMIGTVPTSVPQFILLGNWLLENNFKRKWSQLKFNKLFWILSSVFLIHVAGLLYTSDLVSGWNDVRTKMPLMFLPLIFFTTEPLSKKEFHFLLYCFLAGSLINISWCYIYSFILHKNDVTRSASRFMSHIRLGLYLNIAICVCVYFIAEHTLLMRRIFFAGLIICFLFSMYALGLASGMANFCILLFLSGVYLVIKQDIKIKVVLLIILTAGILFAAGYIIKIYNDQVSVNKTFYNSIQAKNYNGKWYSQLDPGSCQKENGNYVMINLHFEELRREWNKRSPADTFAYTPQYNLERFEILLRYLASKELTKDSLGISRLTGEDIKNIENNVCNYLAPQWSYLHKRVYEIVCEYDEFVHGRNVNGHSLSMRLYFWKASWHLVKTNPLFGTGTGDVQAELNKAYTETNSPLAKEWYKRPHNQFLTITVALGIVGLILFIITLFYPLIQLKKHLHVLYYPFFIIAIISCLLEDTLETQAGLTFFAFFNVLFLSQAWWNKSKNPFKTPHIPAD